MVASSSSFWQVGKHSVSVTYQASATAPGTLDDVTTYTTEGSTKPSSTKGVNTPSAAGAGIYEWRGTGWLRVVTSGWEVVGWGVLENDKDEGEDEVVLVTLAQKTIFSPRSLSIYWRKKDGMEPDKIRAVSAALEELADADITLDVSKLRATPYQWLDE